MLLEIVSDALNNFGAHLYVQKRYFAGLVDLVSIRVFEFVTALQPEEVDHAVYNYGQKIIDLITDPVVLVLTLNLGLETQHQYGDRVLRLLQKCFLDQYKFLSEYYSQLSFI